MNSRDQSDVFSLRLRLGNRLLKGNFCRLLIKRQDFEGLEVDLQLEVQRV